MEATGWVRRCAAPDDGQMAVVPILIQDPAGRRWPERSLERREIPMAKAVVDEECGVLLQYALSFW